MIHLPITSLLPCFPWVFDEPISPSWEVPGGCTWSEHNICRDRIRCSWGREMGWKSMGLKTIINHPILDGLYYNTLYHPFLMVYTTHLMVMLGMVYDCLNHKYEAHQSAGRPRIPCARSRPVQPTPRVCCACARLWHPQIHPVFDGKRMGKSAKHMGKISVNAGKIIEVNGGHHHGADPWWHRRDQTMANEGQPPRLGYVLSWMQGDVGTRQTLKIQWGCHYPRIDAISVGEIRPFWMVLRCFELISLPFLNSAGSSRSWPYLSFLYLITIL